MPLNEKEINDRLSEVKDWEYKENKIYKSYALKDFSSALAFVVKLGIEAEKANHHPDILIHSYKMVDVSLTTHSEEGITGKDFGLAKKIDDLYTAV